MRNRVYRRIVEKLSLKHRKFINNIVYNYNYADEQVKVNQDRAINWMSNEWWSYPPKKKRSRNRRHQFKLQLKKEINNL